MDMSKEDLQELNALMPAITLMIELMEQQKKEYEQFNEYIDSELTSEKTY